MLETIRQRDIKHSLPKTYEGVTSFCYGKQGRIRQDLFLYKPAKETDICDIPYAFKDGVPLVERGLIVNGEVALCRSYTRDGVEAVVARCAFVVRANQLTITHTPQGTPVEVLKKALGNNMFCRRAMHSLSGNDFRPEMVKDLIEIARNLNLDRVVGIPSAVHSKVASGTITPEFGKVCMDDPYIDCGFELEDGKRYVYDLRSRGV